MVVSLNHPVTSYGDFDKMIAASVDGGDEVFPVAIDDSDPSALVFQMQADVSSMNHWRVPGPGNYVFGDGEPLVEPFNGEII